MAFFQGDFAPDAGTGENGDWFFRHDVESFHSKSSGAWTERASLIDMRKVSATPADGFGEEGQIVVDHAAGSVLEKSGGSWAKVIDLRIVQLSIPPGASEDQLVGTGTASGLSLATAAGRLNE